MIDFLNKGLLFFMVLVVSSCKRDDKSGGGETIISGTFPVPVVLATTPKDYIDQLGCLNCHGGATTPGQIKTEAPDLSHAGLRYKPEYLFNFLLNPKRVRNHIGLSRMPNFGFDEKEALAVTLYLTKQINIPGVRFPDFEGDGDVALGKKIFSNLACTSCHQANGVGKSLVSDLDNAGSKLNEKWVKQFIAAPAAFRGQENIMPMLLYHFDADSTSLVATADHPDRTLKHLASFLMSLEAPDHDSQLSNFDDIRESNPEITAELGESIFKSQNCGGCHRSSKEQWKEVVAPDLLSVKSRINKDWLSDFLKKPHSVRPYGFYPGSGSRMPDFKLSEDEIKNIVTFLYGSDTLKSQPVVEKPSRFVANKIENLLNEQLPCLGCHSINGKGGKIAPNLNNLSSRLKPEYIALMINDPEVASPGTIMPKVSMPENIRNQLTAYLTYNADSVPSSDYLSLSDHSITLPNSHISIENIYLSRCALCHGESGGGDGYNTNYLATQPTIHADSSYMSQRPDDTLFDGIFAGGLVLNKSHLMPPWGNSLSTEEITGLVKYIRSLCDCSPPKWSTDNLVRK